MANGTSKKEIPPEGVGVDPTEAQFSRPPIATVEEAKRAGMTPLELKVAALCGYVAADAETPLTFTDGREPVDGTDMTVREIERMAREKIIGEIPSIKPFS